MQLKRRPHRGALHEVFLKFFLTNEKSRISAPPEVISLSGQMRVDA